MAKNLQFEGEKLQKAADQIKKLYKLFINVDATQVEINPLGETPTGDGKPAFLTAEIVLQTCIVLV